MEFGGCISGFRLLLYPLAATMYHYYVSLSSVFMLYLCLYLFVSPVSVVLFISNSQAACCLLNSLFCPSGYIWWWHQMRVTNMNEHKVNKSNHLIYSSGYLKTPELSHPASACSSLATALKLCVLRPWPWGTYDYWWAWCLGQGQWDSAHSCVH